MLDFKKWKEIFIDLIKLSLPIVGGNISNILVNVVDTVVAGRYSTLALGAISVASAIVMSATIGTICLILAISPVIANLRGQKIPSKKYFKLSILFSIIVAIPFFLFTELLIYKIDLFHLSKDMIPYVKEYMRICAWTIFPVAIFVALKEFLQAYEKVVFANVIMLLTVIINAVLNVLLTFGFDWGFVSLAPMGVIGLSIATLASRIFTTLFMVLYCLPLFKTSFNVSKSFIKDVIKTGYPISFAMFFEFLGFNLTAILIGTFSSLYAAVHNIILCIANCTFMIVLGIASAASIKVAYFNGLKNKKSLIDYSVANVLSVMTIGIFNFFILKFGSDYIIKIFSTDAEVLYWAKKVIMFATIFIFFDCLQCACGGILKGMKDTKTLMWATLFAYMVCAIPIGLFFSHKYNIVLEGFWFGLTLALFLVAVITSTKVLLNIKKLN